MSTLETLSPIGGEGRVRGQVCERPRKYARDLRQSQTDAERKLWWRLRDRRLTEFKSRRQHPIGPFVVDFCCTEAKLVEILTNPDGVLQRIALALGVNHRPSPCPLPRGERDKERGA